MFDADISLNPKSMPTVRSVIVSLLLAGAGPAFAMNWEGHDDWMADMSHAQVYESALPEAEPLPPTDCTSRSASHDNPYEQIPLKPDACNPGLPGPSHHR